MLKIRCDTSLTFETKLNGWVENGIQTDIHEGKINNQLENDSVLAPSGFLLVK